MALILGDRIKETTSIVGTGSATLLGATIGFQSFAAVGNGNTTYYCIADQGGPNWEVGIGTYTASGTTLARTTILASSNAGAIVSFTSGIKDVFVTYPSEKGVWYDASGNVLFTGATTISVTDNTNAALRITQTGAGNALVVEDSTNPDSTPFVVDANGTTIIGMPTAVGSAPLQIQSGHSQYRFNSSAASGAFVNMFRSASGTIGTNTIVNSGDNLGMLQFLGADGTNYIQGASIIAAVDGTPGTNDMPGRLVFSTTADGASSPTERMRIDSAGRVGFGSTDLSVIRFRYAGAVSGSAISYMHYSEPVVQSGVTTATSNYASVPSTAAASFTLSNLRHFAAYQGTIGAGSTVTNQVGFYAENNLTGATNNYGFYGNIPAATGRYNLYMGGTADNYMAGSLGIGNTPYTGAKLLISGNATDSSTDAVVITQAIQSSAITKWNGFATYPLLAAGSYTLPTLRHYDASFNTLGAGAAITNQYGYSAQSTLTGATNNFGFYGAIASGTGRYNLYMAGTADNYLGGSTTISVTDNTNAALRITQLGTGNALVVEDSTNPDSSPFAIDATGDVLIGSATAIPGAFSDTGKLQISQNTGEAGIQNYAFTNATGGAIQYFNKSRSATIGTNTIVQSGDTIGNIVFAGADGSSYTRAAQINAEVDGTPGTNDMPGRLVFSTTADGASSPTERMRIDNAGRVGIGVPSAAGVNLYVGSTLTGGVAAIGTRSSGVIQADVTSSARYVYAQSSALATVTAVNVYMFSAQQGNLSGAAITSQYGYHAESSLIGATNNYSFFGNIAAGTGRYNLYMSGTASNYLAGSLGIGTIPTAYQTLLVSKNLTGHTTTRGVVSSGQIQSDSTSGSSYFSATSSTQATTFNTIYLELYGATQGTFGVGSTVTNQYGFSATSSLTGATNNYGFFGNIPSGTGRYNLYMAGTADNYLGGSLITAGLKATSAAAPTLASATTIAPTTQIAFISGTTAIATITAPSPISLGGGQITLIPTGIFTTTTAGNIALASTAVVGKALIMTYDATTTKWYPSY